MIMTTSEHFDTILDSIEDMAESLHAAADAQDDPEAVRERAWYFEALSDAWASQRELDSDQRADIALALERSEEVAREVGEDGAADEYEAARIWLEG